jgi:predicted nucleotidyltransferase
VTTTAATDWLPEIVNRLVREFDPLKIILFGSHARGEANVYSASICSSCCEG